MQQSIAHTQVGAMGAFSHLQKKKAQHGVTRQLHHIKGSLKTCASV